MRNSLCISVKFVSAIVLAGTSLIAVLWTFAITAEAANLHQVDAIEQTQPTPALSILDPSAIPLARVAITPVTGIMLKNANLRAGPSTADAIVGQIAQGKQVAIVGCNVACDWYQLRGSQWVAAFLVGDLSIPILDATQPLTTFITPQAAQVPSMTLRIMTYNVLCGAMAESGCSLSAIRPLTPDDRRPALVEHLSKTHPSILGIQEANRWNQEMPTRTVEFVAETLGMNYYLAETGTEFDLVLLAKFPIVAHENLSAQVRQGGSHGALRATVLLTTGDLVDVYVVHLDPFSLTIRTKQINALVSLMPTTIDRTSILVGDLNMGSGQSEFKVLHGNGWKIVDANSGGFLQTEGIDQIWMRSPEDWRVRQRMRTPVEQGGVTLISDHNPVWADVTILRKR